MEIIKITRKRMGEILPKHIKDSDVLSKEAKKILACLVNYELLHPIAKKCGYVIMPYSILALATKIDEKKLSRFTDELVGFNLIRKERSSRSASTATVYYVLYENFDNDFVKVPDAKRVQNAIESHKKNLIGRLSSQSEMFREFMKITKEVDIIDIYDYDGNIGKDIEGETFSFHPNGKCGCLLLDDSYFGGISCDHWMWAEGNCEGTERFWNEKEHELGEYEAIMFYGNHEGSLVIKLLKPHINTVD